MKTSFILNSKLRKLKLFFFSFLFFVQTTLSSCLFIPIIDSIHQSGLTKSDRQEILPKTLKSFLDALTWGDVNIALRFAKEDSVGSIKESLKKIKSLKIASTKISSIDFDNDAKKAKVEAILNVYNINNLIVKDVTEKESWEFTGSNGWKITDREIVEESN